MNNPLDVANRWIAAYNAKDFDILASMMTADFRIEHHNRGVVLEGPQAMLAIMQQFAALAPARRFHSMRRQFSDGTRVVTELTWEATPSEDIAGFAKSGETIALQLACVWTVRDGLLAECHDYG